jgi:hypothetical protein
MAFGQCFMTAEQTGPCSWEVYFYLSRVVAGGHWIEVYGSRPKANHPHVGSFNKKGGSLTLPITGKCQQ